MEVDKWDTIDKLRVEMTRPRRSDWATELPERSRSIRMLRYDYERFRLALGKRMKELRKQRGFTHAAMVSKYAFHLTQIARIERGEAFSVQMLLRLAETFQVPVGEMISGIGEVEAEPHLDTAIASKRLKRSKARKQVKTLKSGG